MEWKWGEQTHASKARTTEEPGGPIQQGIPDPVGQETVPARSTGGERDRLLLIKWFGAQLLSSEIRCPNVAVIIRDFCEFFVLWRRV